MSYKLITEPAVEPVTEVLLREHATLDAALSTQLLGLYLKSARRTAEWVTGRAMLTQTWEAYFDAFAPALELTMPPIQTVTSVKYYDTDGTLQTLDPAAYVVEHATLPGYVLPVSAWPAAQARANAVIVRFVAGYDDPANVPDDIKHWIYVRAADAVDNRESIDRSGRLAAMPWVDSLLDAHRVHWSV
jgi:uncharacterized phiE125 gp8 family phage protein